MAEPRDLTRDLELHRQVLEETVTKLTNSLHHWQQWYIEYASLQEEVTTLPTQPPTRKDLARIKRDFESEIITKQEVNEIFGKNDLKPADQILSVLDRRLDYVERNVDTLRKQLEAAENKLAASRVLADPDGAVDEESGLPITDIIEEIDEEGNVISHRLQTPGAVSEQVLEALKKAGVDGFGDGEENEGEKKPVSSGELKHKEVAAPTPEEETKNTTAAVSAPKKHKPNGKRKSVSFAEDTKPAEADEQDEEDEEAEKERLRAIKKLEQIMETAKTEQDQFEPEAAVIPEDESEDDAQLRREMLEYSTQEIGPIVAELELDEGVTDDDDYEFEYADEEDEDEEDALGRSKYSVITDDYVKRMQELEKRLGVESAFATERAAPKPEVPAEGLGRIAIQPESSKPPKFITEVTEIDHNKPKAKKGVRFAEELDVAEEDTNTVTLPERPAAKKEPEINPISENVMERSSKPASRAVEAPTKKPSRFKKDRAAGTPTPASLPATPLDAPVRFLDQQRTVAPSGPEGKTIADAVLERDVSTKPQEPDELDANLLHQEAAVEYHRMRNRLIQKQGGFAKEEEKAITTFDELEEEESGKKRMSRFKAARLSRQGQ